MVVLSGYPSALYDELYAVWQTVRFDIPNHAPRCPSEGEKAGGAVDELVTESAIAGSHVVVQRGGAYVQEPDKGQEEEKSNNRAYIGERAMATEFRTELAQHLGHRISIRGAVTEIRIDHQGTRACITDPELEGEILCRHVWVLGITDDWTDQEGSQVTFDAVVRDYNNGDGRNYCLRNPSNLQVISPPAIKIPKLVKPTRSDEPFAAEQSKPQEGGRDAIADIRQAKSFAKQCGSPIKALEIVGKLPDIPLCLLREYLMVLILNGAERRIGTRPGHELPSTDTDTNQGHPPARHSR
jgi:hypothetical protein